MNELLKQMEEIRLNSLPPASKRDRDKKVIGVRTSPKIQRNAPCPCGSGKKYKNCCLNK